MIRIIGDSYSCSLTAPLLEPAPRCDVGITFLSIKRINSVYEGIIKIFSIWKISNILKKQVGKMTNLTRKEELKLLKESAKVDKNFLKKKKYLQ